MNQLKIALSVFLVFSTATSLALPSAPIDQQIIAKSGFTKNILEQSVTQLEQTAKVFFLASGDRINMVFKTELGSQAESKSSWATLSLLKDPQGQLQIMTAGLPLFALQKSLFYTARILVPDKELQNRLSDLVNNSTKWASIKSMLQSNNFNIFDNSARSQDEKENQISLLLLAKAISTNEMNDIGAVRNFLTQSQFSLTNQAFGQSISAMALERYMIVNRTQLQTVSLNLNEALQNYMGTSAEKSAESFNDKKTDSATTN